EEEEEEEEREENEEREEETDADDEDDEDDGTVIEQDEIAPTRLPPSFYSQLLSSRKRKLVSVEGNEATRPSKASKKGAKVEARPTTEPDNWARDLWRKAAVDGDAKKITDFSLPDAILGEGQKEKTSEVADSPPLVVEKPKRKRGRPSKADLLKRLEDEHTAALVALVNTARDCPIDESQPSTSRACGQVSMGNRWSTPPSRFSPHFKKKK
ncbi:hypothetical protein PMAYCL1PPCAC_03434, partial [Pristionchus mayeri]